MWSRYAKMTTIFMLSITSEMSHHWQPAVHQAVLSNLDGLLLNSITGVLAPVHAEKGLIQL